jgi:hypothetical protein
MVPAQRQRHSPPPITQRTRAPLGFLRPADTRARARAPPSLRTCLAARNRGTVSWLVQLGTAAAAAKYGGSPMLASNHTAGPTRTRWHQR